MRKKELPTRELLLELAGPTCQSTGFALNVVLEKTNLKWLKCNPPSASSALTRCLKWFDDSENHDGNERNHRNFVNYSEKLFAVLILFIRKNTL